jgi:FixJ family two-component response regulator
MYSYRASASACFFAELARKRGVVARVPLISIVDDDLSVREATASLLEAHGYVTAAFGSAEEFLGSELIDATSCLVTDLRMTGLSGIELQRRLHEAGHRIPTIIMTAYPDEHMRTAALQGGALGYLAKPVNEDCLISSLEGALRVRHA